MEVEQIGTWPAIVAVNMPVGLKHVDSDGCWCDPVVLTDEHGQDILVHKQVTWN